VGGFVSQIVQERSEANKKQFRDFTVFWNVMWLSSVSGCRLAAEQCRVTFQETEILELAAVWISYIFITLRIL
jgi:hypothetical protein